MAYRIQKEKCIGCEACLNECNFGAVKKDKDNGCYYLDPWNTYLIICAKSRYRVESNKLILTYNLYNKYTMIFSESLIIYSEN